MCSILIFRTPFLHVLNFLFLSSTLSIFSIINFKCYFILFHFVQLPQTYLQYPWQYFLLKLCLVVVSHVSFLSVQFSLFSSISLLSSACLGFHFWLLFNTFFFKSLCLLFHCHLVSFFVLIDKKCPLSFWV